MHVIWKKVWSDLWYHKVRTLLAVISIAVGVFALGAIFGMIDQLIPNLNRVQQSIEPAHLTMDLVDRINQDTADRQNTAPFYDLPRFWRYSSLFC
jgi:putative ABC transport system permease protein